MTCVNTVTGYRFELCITDVRSVTDLHEVSLMLAR